MSKLKPLETAPTPGYPARWGDDARRRPGFRRAMASVTIVLALGINGCSGSGPPAGAVDAGEPVTMHDAAPVRTEGESATRFADGSVVRTDAAVLRGTMGAETLGMPLAIGLDETERGPQNAVSDSTVVYPLPPVAAPVPLPVIPPSSPPPTVKPKPPENPVIKQPIIRMAGIRPPPRLPGRRAGP